MSESYAASDATLSQTPGLKDSTIEAGADSLSRAEDREEGLASNPGITNEATTAMHQGMDQATGERTPSTRPGANTSVENTGGGTSAVGKQEKGVGEQVSETVSGVFNTITKNLK